MRPYSSAIGTRLVSFVVRRRRSPVVHALRCAWQPPSRRYKTAFARCRNTSELPSFLPRAEITGLTAPLFHFTIAEVAEREPGQVLQYIIQNRKWDPPPRPCAQSRTCAGLGWVLPGFWLSKEPAQY